MKGKKKGSSKYTVTVSEVLKRKPLAVLKNTAASIIPFAFVNGRTKRELVDILAYEMEVRPERCIDSFVYIRDLSVRELIRKMVYDGSQTLEPDSEDHKTVFEGLCWVDCRISKTATGEDVCDVALPDEIRDYCRKHDYFNRMYDVGVDLDGLVSCATSLYGVVSFKEIASLFSLYMQKDGVNRPCADSLIPIIEFAIRVGTTNDLNDYFTWNNFVVSSDFETEKENLDEFVGEFFVRRDNHERWLPEDGDEFFSFEGNNEAYETEKFEVLYQYLQKIGFIDDDENYVFVMDCVTHLQLGAKEPSDIINSLLERCTIASQEQLDEFARLWSEFISDLHLQTLNGQTPRMANMLDIYTRMPEIKLNPGAGDTGSNEACTPSGS